MLTRTQVPLEHCLLSSSSVCFLMYKGSKIKGPIVSPVMGVPKGEARARKARKAPRWKERPTVLIARGGSNERWVGESGKKTGS